jgi:hypothetical protein
MRTYRNHAGWLLDEAAQYSNIKPSAGSFTVLMPCKIRGQAQHCFWIIGGECAGNHPGLRSAILTRVAQPLPTATSPPAAPDQKVRRRIPGLVWRSVRSCTAVTLTTSNANKGTSRPDSAGDDGGFEMAIFSGPRTRDRRSCSRNDAMEPTKKSTLAEECSLRTWDSAGYTRGRIRQMRNFGLVSFHR